MKKVAGLINVEKRKFIVDIDSLLHEEDQNNFIVFDYELLRNFILLRKEPADTYEFTIDGNPCKMEISRTAADTMYCFYFTDKDGNTTEQNYSEATMFKIVSLYQQCIAEKIAFNDDHIVTIDGTDYIVESEEQTFITPIKPAEMDIKKADMF